MDQNPYAPPTATLEPRPAAATTPVDQPWFAVGTRKLFVMSFTTLGLYSLYWFERHYRHQKRSSGEKTMPIARAFFSIFFAHDLFRRVEAAAWRADVGKAWSASELAGIFIACAVVSRILDRFADKVPGTLGYGLAALSVLLIGGMVYPLFRVQVTVNELLDRTDPHRNRNESLTAWNWPVVIVGALLLSLLVLASFVPEEAILPQE